jgi:hypothetical protein
VWNHPVVLDDETMVAAFRACEARRRVVRREGDVWFEALCVLEHLARSVGGDRRRFGELREPLGAWIERHGRFTDDAGESSEAHSLRSPVRYIVIGESEWARLQDQSSPPSAA